MPENKNAIGPTDLDELLRNSESLSISREQFGNNVDAEITRLDAEVRNRNSVSDNKHRSKIALILTWAFVSIVGAIVIFGPIFNATIGREAPIDIRGLLESFNSVFGTVLGFAIGYYFKDRAIGKND